MPTKKTEMDNMEYIDNYFKSLPTEQQKLLFEQRVINDLSFAREVAFYISANGLAKEQLLLQKKEHFKEMYQQQKVVPFTKQASRQLWKYLAAASLVGVVFMLTWLMDGNKNSPQSLADQYIEQNFKTLGVSMGNRDSMQAALAIYNDGGLPEALQQFEQMLKTDSNNIDAKKYAGIISLRINNYDKALYYFSWMSKNTNAFSNPGKFYEALTLLKRNKTGDKEEAKKLLQNVVTNDLEGKTYAIQWLKQL